MSDAVTQIKERLSILDVVSPYVELHKAGKSYKGKSPFTSEKTPSFYVSPDRGMYYCFSSSQGGDIFTFIEKMEGVDFKGALKILAEKAGVELVREDPKKRTERDIQYALIEAATQYYFKCGTNNREAQEYIENRGVDGKSIHLWRIGFAPDAWRSLREHLTKEGYQDTAMLSAGLIKQTEGGKEPYDVFRNRIMFPMCDSSGRVVAFSGRSLATDPETPKYVNSPETSLYNKSELLFGYDKAKQGIRTLDFSLVVEGQFDLVLAHQAGYFNTVAVSGTALTDHHVGLINRLSNRVVLALDADRAGVAAMKRAATLMLRRGMDVKVVSLEKGKDPADMIKENAAAFKKKVGTAEHVVPFLLAALKENTKNERAYKLSVREEIVPILAVIPSRIDREHFEGVIAEAIETTKDAVHYEVERLLAEAASPGKRAETAADTPLNSARTPEPKTKDGGFLRTRFLFAAEAFLRQNASTAASGKKLDAQLKKIYGESYAGIKKTMTPEILNEDLMYLERTFPEAPDRSFFEDLATKLTRHRAEEIRQKLKTERAKLAALEKEGVVGEAYTNEMEEIARFSQALAEPPVTSDDLTESTAALKSEHPQ